MTPITVRSLDRPRLRSSSQLGSPQAAGAGRGQIWWVVQGSNLRHQPCKDRALPTELTTRICAKSVPLTSQTR
jgi:hypothetical protein